MYEFALTTQIFQEVELPDTHKLLDTRQKKKHDNSKMKLFLDCSFFVKTKEAFLFYNIANTPPQIF